MAGIGVDIRDVINSLCTEVTYPEKDPVVTEFIDYESNTQATKPQTAEHFLMTTFVDNSVAKPGDLVHFVTSGVDYRIMNMFNETFENEVIYKQCILYKCNVRATVYRPVLFRVDETLEAHEVFYKRDESDKVVAMLIDKLYGSRLDDEDQKIIQQEIKGRILYFPKSHPIDVKDRVFVDTEELPYEVTTIERNTFPGMLVVYLEEDTRSDEYVADVPEGVGLSVEDGSIHTTTGSE